MPWQLDKKTKHNNYNLQILSWGLHQILKKQHIYTVCAKAPGKNSPM